MSYKPFYELGFPCKRERARQYSLEKRRWRERPDEDLISYLYEEIDGLLIGKLYLRRQPNRHVFCYGCESVCIHMFMNKWLERRFMSFRFLFSWVSRGFEVLGLLPSGVLSGVHGLAVSRSFRVVPVLVFASPLLALGSCSTVYDSLSP